MWVEKVCAGVRVRNVLVLTIFSPLGAVPVAVTV